MNSMMGYRGPAGGNLANRQAGNFKGDVTPKGYTQGQMAQFNPDQMRLFQQLFSHASPDSYLGRLAGGDEELFQETEAPEWRNFAQAQGQLGSRFSQLAPGAMSAQRGSGFQQAAGQLGSNFAMDLASRRRELQRQAISDLMGIGHELLGQRPYDRFLVEKPQKQSSPLGGWGGLLGGVAGGIGGAFFGNPIAGAALGSSAFSGL